MADHVETTVRQIMESAAFCHAVATMTAEHDRMVRDIITLTEVEAPS
jgi:hypothetical protein